MRGDDAHGIVDLDHLVHAIDGKCLAVVDAFQLAAKHGTGGDRGELHAGQQ